jgi:DNA-binding transcriptional MocR family regulator
MLAGQLAKSIEEGKLLPGARLPSVRDLMQQHQLSLATVTTALRALEQQGLIEPRHKAGYFVKPIARREKSKTEAQETIASVSVVVRNWGPAEDLFPEQRWQSLLGSVIRRYPHLPTRYPQGYGHPRLRTELARRSAENGCFLKEDELIVTQGATEALFLALRATAEPGDRVIVQAPVGLLFSRLLEVLSLIPVPIYSTVNQAGFVGELQTILEQENPPKVFLLVANYHFPTGALMPLMTKRNVLRMAEKHGLTIIEDDVYGDLQHEGSRPLTLKSFDLKGNVIYVNSCSKSMAPGLRIGWMAAGRWRERVEYLRSASASNANELSQLVLAEFLAQGSHVPHLRKLRSQLKTRTSEYLAIMRPAFGNVIPLDEMEGGFSYWLPLPKGVSTADIRQQIAERWPVLSSSDTPQIGVLDAGLCVNTSVPLTDKLRQSLAAFCVYLRGLYQRAA